jgi:hypothetical protein
MFVVYVQIGWFSDVLIEEDTDVRLVASSIESAESHIIFGADVDACVSFDAAVLVEACIMLVGGTVEEVHAHQGEESVRDECDKEGFHEVVGGSPQSVEHTLQLGEEETQKGDDSDDPKQCGIEGHRCGVVEVEELEEEYHYLVDV